MEPSTNRRATLRAVGLAVAGGLAGCLSESEEPPLSDPTTTTTEPTTTPETATPTEKPTDGSPTATTETTPGWQNPDPDKDHDVSVENRHDEAHKVTLRITHDGETVHEETYDAEAGTDRVVYNFTESPIEGKAEYEVTAELEDGQSERIPFSTDTCHGEVIASVDADGELNLIYSIC